MTARPMRPALSANLRGILLMTGAMAAFAVEDALIKLASAMLPTGQMLAILGFGGALVFVALARAGGHRVVTRALLSPALLARNAAEMVGTAGFVTALVLIPLSTTSAILQAAPLLMTAGAAVFLGETVGWRRWAAVAVGFGGVLLILRPGAAAFDPNALWAVLGVIGMAVRDLVTRRMPPAVPTPVVAASAFVAVGTTGLALLAAGFGTAQPLAPGSLAYMGAALALGIGGYWAIVEATRAGDTSVIAPFRYTRLVFATGIAFVLFAEVPDAATLAGAALVIGSGLYTLYRERRRGIEPSATAPTFPAPEPRP